MLSIKAVGIIAEYNPFHNGHLWHVSQAKQKSGCDCCVAVISGQFTQRGEPAAFDKWTRAAMAVKGGVDLVLELPTVFAVRSAQYFATAGVQLLNSLGVVTHLAFGAETPDPALLRQAASFSTAKLGTALKKRLTAGVTYAAALTDCLSLSGAPVFTQANDILAVEYLRAINRLQAPLTPVVIPRQHSRYHDTEITSPFASASAVRQALDKDVDSHIMRLALPASSLSLIRQRIAEGCGPVAYESLAVPVLYKLRTVRQADLAGLPDMAEGLHHKLTAEALRATTLEELLSRVKSKRYTRTRLQRLLIYALLGLSRQQVDQFDQCGPLYARILAFNAKGRLVLKSMTSQASIPVITKTAHFLNTKQRSSQNGQPLAGRMLSIDTLASDVYALGAPASRQRIGARDFLQSPLYID